MQDGALFRVQDPAGASPYVPCATYDAADALATALNTGGHTAITVDVNIGAAGETAVITAVQPI